VFYNCVVKVYEGEEGVPEAEWVQTFTGFHMGQPSVKGSAAEDFSTDPEDLMTGREGGMEIQMTFQSREWLYNEMNMTSQGAWRPQDVPNNNQPITYQYYDPIDKFEPDNWREFDDIGLIGKEIAINDIWGMGLREGEIGIGALGYRIQKKLQFVAHNVWSSLKDLFYTLHLVPYFTGAGILSYRSYDLDKAPVIIYDTSTLLGAVDQSSGQLEDTNTVVATGLDSELSEVKMDRQRMFQLDGTVGWFTLQEELVVKWAQDASDTYRARNPEVRDVKINGIFGALDGKISVREEGPFNVTVIIDMGQLRLVLLIGALSFLIGAAILGSVTTPFPVAQGIVQVLLLLIALLIISEIGMYSCEVWAEPYEVVYRELKAEARLTHFGVEAEGLRRFAYEERKHEVDNKIFSSLNDEALADGTVNRGLRDFAREELRIKLAQSARRTLQVAHNIFLEPADVIQDAYGRKYFLTSIGRNVGRFAEPVMSVQGFRIS